MVTSFDMNLREIEYSSRIFKYLYGRIKDIYNYNKNKDFIIIVAMFLSLLKSKYPVQYYKLFNQKTLDTNLKITDINLDVLDEIFNLIKNINFDDFDTIEVGDVNLKSLFQIIVLASFKPNGDCDFENNNFNSNLDYLNSKTKQRIVNIFKYENKYNEQQIEPDIILHGIMCKFFSNYCEKPLTDYKGSILKQIYDLIC